MLLQNAKELFQYTTNKLTSKLEYRERQAISYQLLAHYFQLNRLDVAVNKPVGISGERALGLEQAIEQLNKNRPLQHIIGVTEFYGCPIKTDERALIPRPETEELVDWIVNENELEAPFILDIGTGTGCIPIALKKTIPAASVTAIDVSEQALCLATENAKMNNVSIEFCQFNILEQTLPEGSFDIIVSNPPYIPIHERSLMDKNVVDYEPKLALFVSDKEPLIFYHRISELAIQHLNIGGSLYFEIHENYGKELVSLIEDIGFTNVMLKQDLQGKDRMIQAQKFYR